MTREKFESDVWPILCELWPKQTSGLTDEQVKVYWRKLHISSAEEVVAAVRRCAEECKFFPHSSEISKRVRMPDVERSAQPSMFDVLRNQNLSLSGATDQKVALFYWEQGRSGYLKLYGTNRPGFDPQSVPIIRSIEARMNAIRGGDLWCCWTLDPPPPPPEPKVHARGSEPDRSLDDS